MRLACLSAWDIVCMDELAGRNAPAVENRQALALGVAHFILPSPRRAPPRFSESFPVPRIFQAVGAHNQAPANNAGHFTTVANFVDNLITS